MQEDLTVLAKQDRLDQYLESRSPKLDLVTLAHGKQRTSARHSMFRELGVRISCSLIVG
jgi:hypothetical protein